MTCVPAFDALYGIWACHTKNELKSGDKKTGPDLRNVDNLRAAFRMGRSNQVNEAYVGTHAPNQYD